MRYVLVFAGFFAFLATADPALARDHHGGWGGRQYARSENHHSDRRESPRMERGDRRPEGHPEGRHMGRGDRPPLDRFLPDIRRKHPGRLLDVQRGWGPRGERNRIKWLTPDGRVIWLDTDARTGEIYGVEGDEPRRRWR